MKPRTDFRSIPTLPFCLLLLALLSGCAAFDGEPSAESHDPVVSEEDSAATWQLSVGMSPTNPEAGQQVETWVVPEGDFNGEVYGVKIVFMNANEQPIQEMPVENLTSLGEKTTVNTTYPESAEYVTARVAGWETPNESFAGVHGAQIKLGEPNPIYDEFDKSEIVYNSSTP